MSASSPLFKRPGLELLTLDQARRLIRGDAPFAQRALWSFGLYTCLRRGELYSLQWTDVRHDARMPHVVLRRALKTRDVLQLPIHPELVDWIAGWREAWSNIVGRVPHDGDCVFPEPDDGPIAPVVDGKRFRFHALRQSGARLYLDAGAPPGIVAMMLGHFVSRTDPAWLAPPTLEAMHREIARLSLAT